MLVNNRADLDKLDANARNEVIRALWLASIDSSGQRSDDVVFGFSWQELDAIWGGIPPTPVLPVESIGSLRIKATNGIKEWARTETDKAVGTGEKETQTRYENNVAVAREILAGTASTALAAAMQRQLDENKARNPAVYGSLDLAQFCTLLVGMADAAKLRGLEIEEARIAMLGGVEKAQDEAGIDAAIAGRFEWR